MTGPARQLKGRAARLARLMPSGSSSAARTPFVLLVVLLLGGGLITLLLLNSSLNEGSFKLSEYKRQTTDLTDEQQALQRDVDDRSAPGALERRARRLGMVPGGSPAFLNPDGSVRGVPGEAEEGAPVRQSAVEVEEEAPSAPPGTSAPTSPPGAAGPAVPSPPAPAVSAAASAPAAGGQAPPSPPAQPSGSPAPTTSGR